MNFRTPPHAVCGWLARGIGTGRFLVGERHGAAPHVVGVHDAIEQGVDGKDGNLEEAVEVDGGVVGHEGCTEVHVPSHQLFSTNRKIINGSLKEINIP